MVVRTRIQAIINKPWIQNQVLILYRNPIQDIQIFFLEKCQSPGK